MVNQADFPLKVRLEGVDDAKKEIDDLRQAGNDEIGESSPGTPGLTTQVEGLSTSARGAVLPFLALAGTIAGSVLAVKSFASATADSAFNLGVATEESAKYTANKFLEERAQVDLVDQFLTTLGVYDVLNKASESYRKDLEEANKAFQDGNPDLKDWLVSMEAVVRELPVVGGFFAAIADLARGLAPEEDPGPSPNRRSGIVNALGNLPDLIPDQLGTGFSALGRQVFSGYRGLGPEPVNITVNVNGDVLTRSEDRQRVVNIVREYQRVSGTGGDQR